MYSKFLNKFVNYLQINNINCKIMGPTIKLTNVKVLKSNAANFELHGKSIKLKGLSLFLQCMQHGVEIQRLKNVLVQQRQLLITRFLGRLSLGRDRSSDKLVRFEGEHKNVLSSACGKKNQLLDDPGCVVFFWLCRLLRCGRSRLAFVLAALSCLGLCGEECSVYCFKCVRSRFSFFLANFCHLYSLRSSSLEFSPRFLSIKTLRCFLPAAPQKQVFNFDR